MRCRHLRRDHRRDRRAGALPAQSAGRVIDASGRIVMPGGIDPHVHLHHVWIKPDGTPLVTAGPEQVGRAALYGGTTTFIDFAYWRDGVSALEAVEARDQDFVGKSPCDLAYHIMLHSEPPPEFAGQLAEAIEAGYPTLKIFTTNILPSRTGPHDRFRRYLGGVPGVGEVRRARRHPCRGQRHRHAHVCQADPRRPGRL